MEKKNKNMFQEKYQFREKAIHLKLLILKDDLEYYHDKLCTQVVDVDSWIDKLRKESLENFLEAWYAQPLFTDLKVNLDHRLCHNSGELALFLERFGVGCMPTPQLHPGTLFAYGERDLKYKTLYHTLPSHVQAVAIPAAGHALHIENPEACAKLIKGAIHEHTSISPK